MLPIAKPWPYMRSPRALSVVPVRGLPCAWTTCTSGCTSRPHRWIAQWWQRRSGRE